MRRFGTILIYAFIACLTCLYANVVSILLNILLFLEYLPLLR
jgi:hypothetical protein